MSICKPETVADAVRITTEINEAIDKSYEAIANSTTSEIYIDEHSLRTLKQAAELYVDKLGEMKVK